MSATLVIVTANFPFTYKGGEVAFVAPEIIRLARTLQARIVVAPMHATGDRLPLPAGVELDMGLSDALRNDWLRNSLRACLWPGFWREIRRALRCGGLLGVARVWRWAATAEATWHWARLAIPDTLPVVYYTYWRGGATLAVTRLAQQRTGCAAITRVHGYDLYEDRFRPAFQPWLAMYRDLAFAATISEHGRRYLLARCVAPERAIVSRLGTETSAARTLASQDGCVRIASCSMLEPLKRVPMMAQVLVGLAARHPQRRFQWTHFGDGPDMPQVRAALVFAPPNLDVALRGQVSNAVVTDHYTTHAVDVFLLLSRTEGLPVAIQEALAAGLPVIATDVGGVSEAVGADNGVLLVANPTPSDAIAALERVVLHGSTAEILAWRARSRERWERDFDAEINHTAFAQRLQQLFDSL